VGKRRSIGLGAVLSGLIGISILVAMVYVLVAAGITGDRGKDEPGKSVTLIFPEDSVAPDGGAVGASLAATPGPMATGAGEDPGLAIYNKACMVCHDAGVAGAPRLGDKADWEPRVAQGSDRFLQVVIAGMGVMPPRGSCMDCGDEELKAAIRYMLVQAGYAPTTPVQADDARSAEAVPVSEGVSRMQGEMSGDSAPVLR
jgi:cytochrome c5